MCLAEGGQGEGEGILTFNLLLLKYINSSPGRKREAVKSQRLASLGRRPDFNCGENQWSETK